VVLISRIFWQILMAKNSAADADLNSD